MNWYTMAFLSALILTPGFMTPTFFNFNFGLRPDVILAWYFLGMTVGCWSGALGFGSVGASSMLPTLPLIGAAAFGFFFGAGSNILLFRSIVVAPNPGMPLAFINLSVVLTTLVSVGLFWVFPKYFPASRIDFIGFIGVAMTVAGVFILAIPRK